MSTIVLSCKCQTCDGNEWEEEEKVDIDSIIDLI